MQLQGRRHPGSWWHIPPPALAARRLVAAGAVRSGVWGAGPRPLTQSSSFLQMSKVWDDLKPKLHCLFAGPNST